jgi:hypothetical protein
MSLLPPTSSFAERVEALFAVVRGRGLALGALDRVVLARWAESGVPLPVIARGMLRAAERVRWMGTGGGVPRTLGACRPEVEEEIAAWQHRHLGAGPPPDEVFDTAAPTVTAPVVLANDGLPVEVFDTAGAERAPAGSAPAAGLQRSALEAVELSGHSASPGVSTVGAILAGTEPE